MANQWIAERAIDGIKTVVLMNGIQVGLFKASIDGITFALNQASDEDTVIIRKELMHGATQDYERN